MVMLSAHVEYGVQEKYRDSFAEYFCTSANWDPNKQIEDIHILLREGVDVLVIDPMDATVVPREWAKPWRPVFRSSWPPAPCRPRPTWAG
jgi:hypothetical protein